MEYRQLGRSGLKVSRVSLGTWITFGHQLRESGAADLVTSAYDAGINFFDCAEGYADGEAERLLGRAIRRLGVGRDTYCVSSKVYWGGQRPTQLGLSRKHIRDACDASLMRLGLDYIDILFCHRPDPDTPIFETMSAMNELIHAGKICYWGVSRWSDRDIKTCYRLATRYGLQPPIAEQPEYNLLRRRNLELNLNTVTSRYGLGITSTSPLASGVLTGKHSAGAAAGSRFSLPDFDWLQERLPLEAGGAAATVVQALSDASRACGYTPAQLAIGWCLKNPQVSTVLLGASSRSQLIENVGALDAVQNLDRAIFERIGRITADSLLRRLGHRVRRLARPAPSRLRTA